MLEALKGKGHIVLLVIGIVAMVAAVGVSGMIQKGWADEEAALREEVHRVEASAELHDADVKRASTDVIMSATGADAERIATDSEIVSSIASTATTWDSYVTYTEARGRLMDEYGISADSWLLSEFMPEVKNEKTPYGNDHNTIDAHKYNMSFDGADVRCVGYDGDKYRYMAQASASSNYKDVSGSSMFVLFATVDGSGKVSDVDGMAISE